MSLIVTDQPIPLITDTNDVVHIGHTRVTLDTVIVAFREGATPETIAQQYPVLALADVYAVIGYYLNIVRNSRIPSTSRTNGSPHPSGK